MACIKDPHTHTHTHIYIYVCVRVCGSFIHATNRIVHTTPFYTTYRALAETTNSLMCSPKGMETTAVLLYAISLKPLTCHDSENLVDKTH